MNKNALIPRRKVLGLGVALAGLCAGCAVLPDAGSAESAAGSQTASGNKAADKVEKAPLEDINSVHLRDNPELYTVYDDSGGQYASAGGSGRDLLPGQPTGDVAKRETVPGIDHDAGTGRL